MTQEKLDADKYRVKLSNFLKNYPYMCDVYQCVKRHKFSVES